jgi:hypothetical protein
MKEHGGIAVHLSDQDARLAYHLLGHYITYLESAIESEIAPEKTEAPDNRRALVNNLRMRVRQALELRALFHPVARRAAPARELTTNSHRGNRRSLNSAS